MPVPVVAALPMIGKSLKFALSRWQGILAFAGFTVATSFSINIFVNQLTSSALRLWPILAIACLFLLLKEFIRGWLTIKAKEASVKERE